MTPPNESQPESPLTDARHAAFRGWVIQDNALHVGGVPLTRLAERVGRTPFYAYERAQMRRRVDELRAYLPGGVELHYAVKANPMPAVVQHMVTLVDGLDVASAGELRVVLDAGADPARVSFAGPGKQAAELRQALAAGALINVESRREVDILATFAAELNLPARVAIRVNPDFELKTSGMKMGGGAKQFGVDAEIVPQLLGEMKRLGLRCEGFHIFSGSQNLSADSICDAQRKTVDLAVRLAEAGGCSPRIVNIGGGFGIPYFPGERPLDLAPIGENLAALSTRLKERFPEGVLALELGRYLVGEAGVYVCRVIERKISRGQVFLVTDGGLHHHLAASGNFGQVLRKNYPVSVGNKMNATTRETASVVGPLCTPLDLLADRMDLAAAEPGDLVVVMQSGAYGATASPQGFLSHPPVMEVLV
jgi:diaminopimelate decarboxylase